MCDDHGTSQSFILFFLTSLLFLLRWTMSDYVCMRARVCVCVNMFVEPISVKRQSKPVFHTALPAPCSICFASIGFSFSSLYCCSFVHSFFYLLSNIKELRCSRWWWRKLQFGYAWIGCIKSVFFFRLCAWFVWFLTQNGQKLYSLLHAIIKKTIE